MTRISLLIAAAALACAAEQFPIEIRLDSPEPQVAAAALAELARTGAQNQQQLDILRTRLNDEQESVRMAAAGTAARLRDDAAVPALIASLRRADGTAGEAYASALKAITGADNGGGDAAAWEAWHEAALKTTTAGVDAVRQAVDSGSPERARAALHPLLMQRACRDVVSTTLAEVAAGKDPRMAALAREGLVVLGGPTARLALAGLGFAPDGTRLDAAETDEAEEQARPRSLMARILAAQPIRGAHAWTVVIIGLSLIAGFAWWCKRYADKWKVVKARVRDVTHRFVRRVKKALGRS